MRPRQGALRPARRLQPRRLRGRDLMRHPRLRRRSARREPDADRRLRALRLLPADVPDLRAVGRGDGLAARADRADAGRARGGQRAVATHGRPTSTTASGCMACVTACPSGVQYDKLIEDARAQVERSYDAPARASGCAAARSSRSSRTPAACARWCRSRCGAAAARRPERALRRPAARALRALMRAGARSAPRSAARAVAPPARARRRPAARAAARVGFLQGCVQRVFFGDVNEATVARAGRRGLRGRTRRAEPRCCGALQLHAGDDGARARSRTRDDRGVRGLRHRRGQRRRLRLGDEGLRAPAARRPGWASAPRRSRRKVARRHRAPGRASSRRAARIRSRCSVAYHDACHLAHAQGVRAQPRELLRGDPRARARRARRVGDLLRLGRHLQPDQARARGRARPPQGRATCSPPAPTAIAAANPGCALQIAAHPPSDGEPSCPSYHPIELLHASIRGAAMAA